MECGCLHGRVIENGCTRNPLTLSTVPVIVLYCIGKRNISQSFQINSEHRRAKTLKPARLLNLQIIALLFPFTVQKSIYPPVSKVHARSFPVSEIHWTLTWTTGSLTCVREHHCAIITHGGVAHRQRVSTTLLTRKNWQFFLVFLTGFEPLSFGFWE